MNKFNLDQINLRYIFCQRRILCKNNNVYFREQLWKSSLYGTLIPNSITHLTFIFTLITLGSDFSDIGVRYVARIMWLLFSQTVQKIALLSKIILFNSVLKQAFPRVLILGSIMMLALTEGQKPTEIKVSFNLKIMSTRLLQSFIRCLIFPTSSILI